MLKWQIRRKRHDHPRAKRGKTSSNLWKINSE
jgi:hypothetical protein